MGNGLSPRRITGGFRSFFRFARCSAFRRARVSSASWWSSACLFANSSSARRPPLSGAGELPHEQLAGHRIWLPGIIDGSEWAGYYADLADTYGLSIDALGPHFSDEALMEQIATSPGLATIVGDRDRYLWPAHYDLRRNPLRAPTPVYPHSLIWSKINHHHHGLTALRSFITETAKTTAISDACAPRASDRNPN